MNILLLRKQESVLLLQLGNSVEMYYKKNVKLKVFCSRSSLCQWSLHYCQTEVKKFKI